MTACLSAILANWLISASLGGPPADTAAPAAAAGADAGPPKYQGTRECIRCHKAPTDDDRKDGITKFYDLTEYLTWAEKDKHSLAYKVLKNSRSKQMGLLLGIAPETDASCVSCHAVKVDAGECAEGDVLKVQEKGVSCEACHGPASNWVDEHWHPNKWRNVLTREQKSAKGLVDLRDVTTRANVCLSCHVGNAQQGKVVTHEMFAAGHPPISGFEIETFSIAMPKHWKPMSVQPPEIQKQYADQRDPDKPETMVTTRMMAIGGLVALRGYADLISHNAAARGKPQEKDIQLGKPAGSPPNATELAFYDCQACHHELTVDSWRQKRGYPGRPGRPAARAWPIALGKLAATACGEHQKPLEDALQGFYRAIDKQPFGAPAELVAASKRLMERTDDAIGLLKTQRFSEEKGLTILKAICATGATELPDFETARQLGWTSLIVYHELPKNLHSKEIDDVLAAITAELSLTLPSRAEEMPERTAAGPDDGSGDAEYVCVASKSVPQTLAAAAKYDPLEFQKHCKKLAELLGSAPTGPAT